MINALYTLAGIGIVLGVLCNDVGLAFGSAGCLVGIGASEVCDCIKGEEK